MVDEEEVVHELELILNSETFKKSSTLNTLLRYLVESTLDKKDISANTIGLELFRKKYNPDKNDVNIRVNVSHLRKKLAKYYENEGVNDPLIISFHPGQYHATFTKKRSAVSTFHFKKLTGLGVGLLILFGLFIWQYAKHRPSKVWSNLLTNGLETTLYLGDVFGFSGPNAFGRNSWQRDANINSPEEFYSEVKKNPEKYAILKPARYSYVVFENSFIIKPITKYFTENEYDFSISPTTDFKIRSIADRNTIYAGPLYVQHSFNELFNEFAKNVHLKVETNPRKKFELVYTKGGVSNTIPFRKVRDESEHALVSAFNGPNNTRHLMFFSNHGMGLVALVDHFTNVDSLRAFTNRHLNDSDEFVALYFVKGKDRTSVSKELVLVDDNR